MLPTLCLLYDLIVLYHRLYEIFRKFCYFLFFFQNKPFSLSQKSPNQGTLFISFDDEQPALKKLGYSSQNTN